MKKSIYILIIFTVTYINIVAQTPYVIFKNYKVFSSENMCLDPAINKKYKLDNLIDGSLKTAWVFEKSCPNEEVKQPFSVSFYFNDTIEINQIQLSNGYLKSKNLYQANNRTNSFELTFSDASKSIIYCKDTFGIQSFNINKRTRSVKLTIKEWTIGNLYDDHCISEIKIINQGKNLLEPKGFKIENKAGWYSSDVISLSNDLQIDMSDYNPLNGFTDPQISKDRRFILYNSNSDGCEVEIIDSQLNKIINSGKIMAKNKLCPQDWISNSELIVFKMNEFYEVNESEAFIYNVKTNNITRKK